MRRLALAAMAGGILGLGGPEGDARAGATVDLLFVAIDGDAIAPTDTVSAAPGGRLVLALRMSNDESLGGAAFSLSYDVDGRDELDVVSAFQWTGVAISRGVQPETFGPFHGLIWVTEQLIGTFAGFTESTGVRTLPAGGSYQMGTVVWSVNASVDSDGADVISNLFNGVFWDAGFVEISDRVRFGAATVNVVPEPGTGLLLAVGLLLASRWSRA